MANARIEELSERICGCIWITFEAPVYQKVAFEWRVGGYGQVVFFVIGAARDDLIVVQPRGGARPLALNERSLVECINVDLQRRKPVALHCAEHRRNGG